MKNSVATLDHVNFTVSNLDESVGWYKKVFNFELVEQGVSQAGDRWGILKSGNTMLAITEYPERILYSGNEYHQIFHFGLKLKCKTEWATKIKEHDLETFYATRVILMLT